MRIIKLFGTNIYDIQILGMLDFIHRKIRDREKVTITYTTFHSLNLLYSNTNLQEIFNKFSLVHPDGIGLCLSTRLMFGHKCLIKKFTGSDFYPTLIRIAIQQKWRIFFFGDKSKTLTQIPIQYPSLEIAGYISGYDYNSSTVIKKINAANPNIVVVGLGQPKQEKWIIENKDKLDVNVILAVGDGIKVFAGVKPRGPKFIQKVGLEWLVRLIHNPRQYWKRYLIGIPLFIFRVLKEKYKK